MRQRNPAHDQLARARLAYVSAGQPSLTAPRHALEEPDPEPEEIAPPPPPSPPDSWLQRLQVTRTHLVALAVVGLVVVLALGFAWSRASAETIPASTVIESSAPILVETPASSLTGAPQRIRVHVLGGVVSPGVITLEDGAIVADAIEAAGGLSPEAVPGELNLAAPVTGGMQIRVGTGDDESRMEGATVPSAVGDAGGKVNLNTADAAELESLPGVGPVMAAAIIAWRDEHGAFTSPTELQEISGVGPKTFAKLEPLVSV